MRDFLLRLLFSALCVLFLFMGCYRIPNEPEAADIVPAQLYGTAELEYQDSRAGIEVTLFGEKKYTTYTDTSGIFAFFDISPGSYTMYFYKRWFEGVPLRDITISSYDTLVIATSELYAGEPIVSDGYDPCWAAPFSKKFVFVRDIGGESHLFIYNIGLEKEYDFNFPGRFPEWSPSGEFIVFENADGGIYRIDTDGSNPYQLSQSGRKPRISDDGSMVVFHREELSDSGVYAVYSSGSRLIQIDSRGKNADIAPDNKHVVYERGINIVLKHLDTLHQEIVLGNGMLPQLSPDHDRIAYFHDWGNAYSIYVHSYSGSIVNVLYWWDVMRDFSWTRGGTGIFFSDYNNSVARWDVWNDDLLYITREGSNPVATVINGYVLFERNGGIRLYRLH